MNTKIILIVVTTFISTVLLMLLFGVLYFNFLSQPTSSAEATPTGTTGDADSNETLTIEYNKADVEAFKEVGDLNYEFEEVYTAPEPLPISVSAGDEALEEFLNAVAAYQEHFLRTIPAATYAVYQAAQQDDTTQLLRAVEAVRIEIERGHTINNNLKVTRNALQNQFLRNSSVNADSRAALNETLQKVIPITSNSDQFLALLEQGYNGEFPSQELVSEFDQSQRMIAGAWVEFTTSLEKTIGILTQSGSITSQSSQ